MTTRRSPSITIREVARKAGVSVATVSRHINRNTPVSPEVAKRLDEVMTELKFVPHAAARHLASRKTHVVGLLLASIHHDFFAHLLTGIEQVVRRNNYNLFVATYRADGRQNSPLPIGPHNTDGMLVFAASLTDEDLRDLHTKGFPIVLVYRTPPASLPIPSVTIENKSATYKLIEHLILSHGKRQIMLVRGPEHQEDSYWRETGYRSALEAYGIPFDENLVIEGAFEREVAYETLKRFLESEKRAPFDAIFAGDDDSAIGVLKALREFEYRVPEDIAVAGFDDLPLSAFLTPPLTTVRAPTEMVGQIAAEKLFGLLNKEVSNEVVLLPTEIIIRRSCGCETQV
jgi:DNA-binding LacI/PurR family transcriptional regulator